VNPPGRSRVKETDAAPNAIRVPGGPRSQGGETG
jgi:hypothetical protein